MLLIPAEQGRVLAALLVSSCFLTLHVIIKPLGRLTQLKTLDLSGCDGIEDLSPLAALGQQGMRRAGPHATEPSHHGLLRGTSHQDSAFAFDLEVSAITSC